MCRPQRLHFIVQLHEGPVDNLLSLLTLALRMRGGAFSWLLNQLRETFCCYLPGKVTLQISHKSLEVSLGTHISTSTFWLLVSFSTYNGFYVKTQGVLFFMEVTLILSSLLRIHKIFKRKTIIFHHHVITEMVFFLIILIGGFKVLYMRNISKLNYCQR